MQTSTMMRSLTAAIISVALLAPTLAQSPNYLSIGGRYHNENSVFTDLPYGNGDLSYVLAYTLAEQHMGLQFGVGFAPDVSGLRDAPNTNQTDYIITPQAHLILRDGCLRGGAGILASYLRDNQKEGEWIAPFYQLQLGINLPLLQRLSIDASVYYTFEKWENAAKFRPKDLEYGLWLNYNF